MRTHIKWHRHALLSEDRTQRWRLDRWVTGSRGPYILYVGLNPSLADASVDDPTIRRLMGFTLGHGLDRFMVGNVYPVRTADPKQLTQEQLSGLCPRNFEHVERMAADAHCVVACWGTNADPQVAKSILTAHNGRWWCFGKNQDGSPKHPLYLKRNTPLEIYLQ